MIQSSKLKPKVRFLAKKLKRECEKAGFSIDILHGFRTIEEQDALYAQGRTRPGGVITRRKGGYSFHNFGVAFDIIPTEKNENEKFYIKAGEIGKRLGLAWGGDWKEFVDMPHFYYTAGYSIEDFRSNQVDWSKFDTVIESK